MPSSRTSSMDVHHGSQSSGSSEKPTSDQTPSHETRLKKYMSDKDDDLHHRISSGSNQTQTVADKLGPHYANLPTSK